MEKVLLSYSGGLDTSVCIKILQEKYNMEVFTFTADLGYIGLEEVKQKALEYGAKESFILDAREEFTDNYIFSYIKAGMMYENKYPLATALGRPLIARHLVELAQKKNIHFIAHGCTGKGNDQIRFDVSIGILAPEIKIIAPIRELNLTRDWELKYAKKQNMDFSHLKSSLYSIDKNIWGRSLECGKIEDLWNEPIMEMFEWTKEINETPVKPTYLEIEFEKGSPFSLDGKKYNNVELIEKLNKIGGENGVGRIDHVENYIIGLKSREIYECPAACILLAAHKALEEITIEKITLDFKNIIANEYAKIIYQGFYFTHHRKDLEAYFNSSQEYVTGTIRVKLHRGNILIVGRKSPYTLYKKEMATYDKEDEFDHSCAEGFIKLFGFQFIKK